MSRTLQQIRADIVLIVAEEDAMGEQLGALGDDVRAAVHLATAARLRHVLEDTDSGPGQPGENGGDRAEAGWARLRQVAPVAHTLTGYQHSGRWAA